MIKAIKVILGSILIMGSLASQVSVSGGTDTAYNSGYFAGQLAAKVLFLILGMLFLVGCTAYNYEVCKEGNNCERFQITSITQPSLETQKICNPDWKESGADKECENVPDNQLLKKGGTDKQVCNGHSLSSNFVDNYWNSEGLIDGCQMPINAKMDFIWKQHDQSIRSHTGTVQIRIDILNFDDDYKALQIFFGEDNNNDNLPDEWKYCGNVDKIKGYSTKYIRCSGTNLKFVRLMNPEWNKGSLFIDEIEVLKV